MYFYETKFGSEEAKKVKASGAKWNPIYKVWESEKQVEGVKEAKPNHIAIFHAHTEKARQAQVVIDWMASLHIDGKPIPEEKYEQCFQLFEEDNYENACCKYAIKLYKKLIDEGYPTQGFAGTPEEYLFIRQ